MAKMIRELEYPFFVTELTKLKPKQNVHINPYNELMHFCFENYYDKFEHTGLSLKEFMSQDLNAQKGYLKAILDTLCDDVEISTSVKKHPRTSKDYNSLEFRKNGTLLCELMEIQSTEVVVTYKYITSSTRSLRLEFPQNKILDFLLEESEATNVYCFYEIPEEVKIEESKNQLDMAICLMIGLINYSDFVKFHKINSIKVNSIASYIESNENLKDSLDVDYDFDKALVTYKKGKDGEDGFELFVINYKNYVEDVEKMFNKILGK